MRPKFFVSAHKHDTLGSSFKVFAAHREIVVAVHELDSITGTSGVIAWQLGHKNIHLIIMWSIPYNLGFFNAYFGFGMVHLSTKVETPNICGHF